MKTTAERVAAMRRRHYEQGLSHIGFWVPMQHADSIRAIVERELIRLTAPPVVEEVAAASVRTQPAQDQRPPKTGGHRAVPWKITLSAPGSLPDGLKKRLRKAGFRCVDPMTWRGDAPAAVMEAFKSAIAAAGALCEPAG